MLRHQTNISVVKHLYPILRLVKSIALNPLFTDTKAALEGESSDPDATPVTGVPTAPEINRFPKYR